MNSTLASKFQKSKGSPVDVGGVTAYPIYEVIVGEGEQDFLFRRINSKLNPVQGLRLKIENGVIEINGEKGGEFILWSDNSPKLIKVKIIPKKNCKLKFWNVWRMGGLIQAWVGNAGMTINKCQKSVVLGCSDGVGVVDFSDFVIEMEGEIF
ncbi:hypothetical protein [Oleiagrimonas sp. MCCC 1A03011]|uniref:hypothetical protein n=1 Tax=Oleiagrimonas sp. MCCC 1A03011 TaxID=1926883 RepID=UPI000DC5A737|nr:hypothetical protein [Oleiagrimonas sp. MCCC 1A03011]RAP56920.1 hypothetical protein BTJ49_12325 [Oleiagrimonas sp. MCCC 1A03011]